MVSQDSVVRAFQTDLEEFTSGIHDFWNDYGRVVDLHLADLKCLKSIFGGDIFPSYVANIACSVGLYMDTVVLPDPLLRILSLAKVMPPKEALRLVTKHALSAMRYKELALADVDPPIVVVAADPIFLEPSYAVGLQVTADGDVIKHASVMFGRNFSSVQELAAFLGQFSNADELAGNLVDPKRFLFDSDWSEPPAAQFTRYIQVTGSQAPGLIGSSVGETTYTAFLGRMMQTNDLLFRSSRYGGTPLIDAPTSWQYLLWKYEYDSDGPDKGLREAVISRAIVSQGESELGMLSGVPPDALVELRRNGAMTSLRETIRTGLNDIDMAAAGSLLRVTNEVVGTIDRSFEEHDRQLKSLSSSRRNFFGLDVSRWIVTGGLSVAAALAHNVGLAVLAATVPKITGAPSIPDLRKRWQELQADKQKWQRSPAAVLFRHLGHKYGFSSKAKG